MPETSPRSTPGVERHGGEPGIDVTTLGDLLVRGSRRHPDRAAVVFPDEQRTYEELYQGAVRTARGLYALGVRPGDHVGILMPNCVEFLEALFAATLLDAIPVPMNARYKLTETGYLIKNADLVTILTTDRISEHVDFAAVLRAALPSIATGQDPTRLDLSDAPLLRSAVMLRGEEQPGFVGRSAFEDLADAVDESMVHSLTARARVRDVAIVLYTSGTTSNPKGCMLSHEALVRSGIARVRERFPIRTHEVFWSGGPLFHIGSLAPLIGCLGVGGTYLTSTHFDPGQALELMAQNRVTSAWPLFPAIMQALLEHPDFDVASFEALRSLVLIGPAGLLLEVQEMFPDVELLNCSGMTETAAMYAMSLPTDTPQERATTGGILLAGFEAVVIDIDTGEEVAAGVVGELLVRGYSMMEGYYRDPEQTARVVDSKGWLHTGDLYEQTDAGHLVFHGRLKDMLKVGGENVAAIEIEGYLSTHPAVRTVEVVGIPDARLDEVPVAFVEPHRGAEVNEQELIEFCVGRIASFKVPRRIHRMAEADWPMSATKVDKVRLRELARQSMPEAPQLM